MLKLKLQYFGYLMLRTDFLEKILMLGKTEGGKRRGGQRMRDGWMASPTWWTWVWASSGSWWWTGKPGVLWSMGLQRVRHDCATELNWNDSKCPGNFSYCIYSSNKFTTHERTRLWSRRTWAHFLLWGHQNHWIIINIKDWSLLKKILHPKTYWRNLIR